MLHNAYLKGTAQGFDVTHKVLMHMIISMTA